MKKIQRNILACLLLCALLCQSVFAAQGMANFTSKNIYIEGQFTDVPKGEWYSTYVRSCYRSGLMDGMTASKFAPDGKLKICEAITIAARVHNIYRSGPGVFDKSTKPWYDTAVKYAINAKIITADQFKDYEAYATRAEMAQIFAGALPASEMAIINIISALPDVPQTHPNYDSILLLYQAGILSGTDIYGTYKPNDPVVRREAATIISKITVASMRTKFVLTPPVDPVVPPVDPVTPPIDPPVTPPTGETFDTVTSFSGGFSIVGGNALYGYCNTSGKLITPIKYAQAFPFSEGKGVVLTRVGTTPGSPDYHANPLAYWLGYVDTLGAYHSLNYIIEGATWTGGHFSSGYLTIEKSDSPLIASHKLLLDANGKELKLASPSINSTRFAKSGVAQDLILVADTAKQSKYPNFSFVDVRNNTAFELPSFDKLVHGTGIAVIDAKPFYGNMAAVLGAKFENGTLISQGWGAVNTHGDMTVFPKYGSFITSNEPSEFPVFAKEIAVATLTGDKIHLLVTAYGVEMLSGQYESLSPSTVRSPYILGEKNNVYTFLDNTGAIVFTCNFADVDNFSDGYAAVQQNGLYGFIDLTGDVVINIMYEDVTDFSAGFAWGKLNGKWEIIKR